jgi:hypothetical protein
MRIESSDARRMVVVARMLGVMPGLDPGIHDEAPRMRALQSFNVARPHGLPGHARQ